MKPIAFICIAFLLGSCKGYLTSSQNVSESKEPYEKVLVLGRSKDNSARIQFENQMVEELKANGVTAVASYTVDGTKNIEREFSESEVQNVEKKLIAQGFDGAIITNLINASEYTDVIAGNTSTIMVPARFGRFGRYYAHYPLTTWEPDQLVTGMKYVFESSFYSLKTGNDDNLQWIGRFEIKDPSSLIKTSSNYAKELVATLIKESITN